MLRPWFLFLEYFLSYYFCCCLASELFFFLFHCFFNMITKEFLDAKAALQLKQVGDLPEALSKAFQQKETVHLHGDAALRLTQQKSKALLNVWQHIAPWLDKALAEKMGDADDV